MVLNALAVDPRKLWKGNWRWYHEELLNCCVDLEEVKATGITLNVFSCLAQCQGLRVEKNFAQDKCLQDFREAVQLACVENDANEINPLLVVSYDRAVLEQTGAGHFSPIPAYDSASDQVLILDTARFKYVPHWVPLPLLFDAMQPIDLDTGKSRGYVLLSYLQNDTGNIMPISVLLRSTMAQNHERQLYKRFLTTIDSEIQWEQVLDYWTKNGKNRSCIWEMVGPQVCPTEKAATDTVAALRILLKDLLPSSTPPHDDQRCYANSSRVVKLAPEEAIFIVVYLASLSPDRRVEIVYSAAAEASDVTRQQLLVDAELVRYTIDVCDEMEEVERLAIHGESECGHIKRE